MLTVFYTPEAEQDLQQVVEHIARDNLSAAVSWLESIKARFTLLASQPALGERMQTRHLGEVRRHIAGSYVVYYRAVGDCLQVLRVLHGARDQERLV